MKGVVVGVDESVHARAALRWAVAYATDHRLPVTAVMAWDFIAQHHFDEHAAFDPTYNATRAQTVLDELVACAVGDRPDIRRVAVCDHAARALVEAADIDASLLVVGARGLSA